MTETPNQPGLNPEIQSPSSGSYISGLIGAVLGAAVGTIPWFLASTFLSVYIGWLGFIVGWVSLCGYKLLRGTKSTVYASVVVYITSILAIVTAFFFSNMYTLFQDAEFADTVEFYGMSKTEATWIVLTDIENRAIVIKDLVISLVIGVLGLLITKKTILAYTDPKKAAEKSPLLQQAAADSALPGVSLPFNFELTEKKSVKTIGIVVTVIFAAFLILSLCVGISDGDPDMYFIVALFAVFTLLGVYMIMDAKRRKLTVNGERLSYTTWLGKTTEFSASQIAFIKRPDVTRLRLFSADGAILAKLETNMQNYPLFAQYLAERQVELRG